MIDESVLQSSEKIVFALRKIYRAHGYAPYRMSKFEEYDLYARNKDFLVSENVITFTDTDGKLMALKPDVTLSIIKNSTDAPEVTQKVFYNENVYRVAKNTGSFKEILQAGVECFGRVEESDIGDVLTMAIESLRVLSPDAILAVSDLSILSAIIERLALPADREAALYRAIGDKNVHAIEETVTDADTAALLKELLSIHGTPEEVWPRLDARLSGDEYARFRRILHAFAGSPLSSHLRVDFSVMGEVNYYNGIVFQGFIRDIPVNVLSGGQYDRLMRKCGRTSCAIGFAVYTDALDRLDLDSAREPAADDGFLNVALPKGRLGEKIYDLFARAGYECPAILEPNRKLIFENADKKVRYFWVKPSDVAIYVEHGAADIGVVGKDILLEYAPDVYELLDLKKGICRMAVAAPKGYRDNPAKTLRVATKFAGIAKAFYRTKGRDIDIIHLNGSIEIAPILGLSDVIVDIVETGTTLKENDLEVIETILPISARLITNKSAFKFKDTVIEQLADRLSAITEETV